MASSIPGALDYLVTMATTAVNGNATVSDGWPIQRSDALVAIGITPEDDDAPVVGSYAELSRDEYEDVEVPCIIAVRKAGTAAASAARTAAFALLDAIRAALKTDRRLNGAVVPGLPARVARYEVSQTAEPKEAGEARWCEIRFTVAWQHRG
jgi:hypothetical protein